MSNANYIELGVMLSIILFLALFWAVMNALGKTVYSEPQKLKRELRLAHGEPAESSAEEAEDRKFWFGWIPKRSVSSRTILMILGITALVIVILIWHVLIIATIGMMFTGPVLGWLLPVLIALAAIGIVGWLAGYSKIWKATAAVGVICIALACILWINGTSIHQGTSAPTGPRMVSTRDIPSFGLFTVAGNADTDHLVLSRGAEIVEYTGSNLTVFVRFNNGSVCAIGKDPMNPGCHGPLFEEWAHNESSATTHGSYQVLENKA